MNTPSDFIEISDDTKRKLKVWSIFPIELFLTGIGVTVTLGTLVLLAARDWLRSYRLRQLSMIGSTDKKEVLRDSALNPTAEDLGVPPPDIVPASTLDTCQGTQTGVEQSTHTPLAEKSSVTEHQAVMPEVRTYTTVGDLIAEQIERQALMKPGREAVTIANVSSRSLIEV